jgi:hypothetical protein
MNTTIETPRHNLLIDGKYVAPANGNYSTILNPSNEETIASNAFWSGCTTNGSE